jgi:hypothetical protein
LNTVFQGPKSLGRSRHGAPVRLHHSFQEVAIVTPRTPGAFPQRYFDPLPLPLIQLQAHHRGHPMEHTCDSMESPLF